MHDDEEDDEVEEQVHRQDVGERPRAAEQPALQQRERDREHRAPRLVAELPEERDEDDRLQTVRLPVREMPAQQRVDGADEEQLGPDPLFRTPGVRR